MELHIPDQKFTLTEGGFGNVRIEILPANEPVMDETITPAEAPAVVEATTTTETVVVASEPTPETTTAETVVVEPATDTPTA